MDHTPQCVSVGAGAKRTAGIATLAMLAISLYAIPSARAATIYVLPTGDDGADGSSPAMAVRTIGRAAGLARPGDRVVVGPGKYLEGDISPAAFGRVRFLADRRGTETGVGPGDVVLDAGDHGAGQHTTGFVLNNKLAVTIDGFVVYGAVEGIYVKSRSDQAVISNNVVSNNAENGIYVEDSKNAVVFNNLVYNNGHSGILVGGTVSGSPGAQVINNTVYGNGNRGVFFAGTSVNSPGGLVLNNIVQGNVSAGIQVNTGSLPGYVTAGNVSSDRFASGTPVDITDVRADAAFLNPVGADGVLGGAGYADDDFHLSQQSAGQAATSPAVDAGSDRSRALRLTRGTTRTDKRPDTGFVDAGYHYRNYGGPPLRPQVHVRYIPLYVDPVKGSDDNDGRTPSTALQSLRRTLQMARPGNRVMLLSGVHHLDPSFGSLTFSSTGTPGRSIVVQGRAGAIIDATGFVQGIVIAGKSNITLVNLDVRGASQAGIRISNNSTDIILSGCHLQHNFGVGLSVNQASVTVTNSTINDNVEEGVRQDGGTLQLLWSAVTGNGGKGVSATNATQLTVQNSRIGNNRDDGILVLTSQGVSISGCQLQQNFGVGLVLSQTTTVTVADSTFNDNVEDGVRQDGGATQLLRTVLAGNGGKGVSAGNATQLVVQSSRVENNGDNGIQTLTSQGVSISGSVIDSNLGDGLNIYDSPATQIVNDLIYANSSSGIVITGDVTGSPNAQVLNNTIYGNSNRGLLLGGSNLKPPSANARVLRNIFQGNAVAGLQVNDLSLPGFVGDYNLTADAYGSQTPVGLHDIVDDPLLVNPAGADGVLGGGGAADDDFHLSQLAAGQTVTSAGVDAGGTDVVSAGLSGTSTRTDGVADSGSVDIGYHYAP